MADPRRVPRSLRLGDEVAVVAPSGPVDAARLAGGVDRLERWGLQVHVLPHVLDRGSLDYLAGTDADRAADLQEAWLRPSTRAVICARGGYGASRVLDHVDWASMATVEPRWFVGSSDSTALHEALGRHLGIATVLGPMAAGEVFSSAEPDDPTLLGLHEALFNDGALVLDGDGPTLVPGTASGVLIGGNLALLTSTIGTPESTRANGAIVLLEDVAEPPYRIDRMLTQLLRSGWFDGVWGVVLGSFVDCGDVLPVLRDRLTGLDVPVRAGFAVGHGARQLSVRLGAPAELDADRGMLRVR